MQTHAIRREHDFRTGCGRRVLPPLVVTTDKTRVTCIRCMEAWWFEADPVQLATQRERNRKQLIDEGIRHARNLRRKENK